MGFTDLIIKISNTKFAHRFQYEPYIIKSVEYIDPQKEDMILVIYKDTDYIQSLTTRYIKRENYVSFEAEQKIDLNRNFDKVVLFFSINDIDKESIDTIKKHLKRDGKLYSVFYLNSGKFFELVLRISDKEAHKHINKKSDILTHNGFMLVDELKLPRQHISISEYRIGEGDAGKT